MSNPVCTLGALNNSCFTDDVVDPHIRKAMLIYYNAFELNALGGTNYLNNLTGSAAGGLVGDTNAFADFKVGRDRIGERVIGTFEIATAFRNANAASGGTAPSVGLALMQNIACLRNVNESMMDRMILFLTCNLGVHKTYPQ